MQTFDTFSISFFLSMYEDKRTAFVLGIWKEASERKRQWCSGVVVSVVGFQAVDLGLITC